LAGAVVEENIFYLLDRGHLAKGWVQWGQDIFFYLLDREHPAGERVQWEQESIFYP
jgi:hypothetical protein